MCLHTPNKIQEYSEDTGVNIHQTTGRTKVSRFRNGKKGKNHRFSSTTISNFAAQQLYLRKIIEMDLTRGTHFLHQKYFLIEFS